MAKCPCACWEGMGGGVEFSASLMSALGDDEWLC